MSDRLVLARNRIEQHRAGRGRVRRAAQGHRRSARRPDNIIVANRVGVYAEGVPDRPGREARLAGNVIAGNEVGLALQGNAALTVTDNRIADNLTDVRRARPPALVRDRDGRRDGRGNSWSQYRGYDADRRRHRRRAAHGRRRHGRADAPQSAGAGVSLHARAPGDRGRGADVPVVPAAAGARRRASADVVCDVEARDD